MHYLAKSKLNIVAAIIHCDDAHPFISFVGEIKLLNCTRAHAPRILLIENCVKDKEKIPLPLRTDYVLRYTRLLCEFCFSSDAGDI